MATTKTLKQLYILLLNRVEREFKNNSYVFICNQIYYLYQDEVITEKEYDKLQSHFQKNKPSSTQHVKFYKHDSFLSGCHSWWSSTDRKQRVLFIEHLISKLK